MPYEVCSAKAFTQDNQGNKCWPGIHEPRKESGRWEAPWTASLAPSCCRMLHTCQCTTTDTALQKAHAMTADTGRFIAQDPAGTGIGVNEAKDMVRLPAHIRQVSSILPWLQLKLPPMRPEQALHSALKGRKHRHAQAMHCKLQTKKRATRRRPRRDRCGQGNSR